ncbi:holin [Pseudoramibacter sp.]|uniref:holin n=1 Tax=Pseudoramibacter sp. TaxID=2034862 RepID=UPI0025DD5FD9|nr:holin [Pseudoramibacter sp.]MCH4071662.1 holin [Pseudoramibacter sp.]MCH4105430.1 holin [Pseudoramibacter sp.]
MKAWLKAAGLRALRTFIQTFAAALAVGTTLANAPWREALSQAALAALLALLGAASGLPELSDEDHL